MRSSTQPAPPFYIAFIAAIGMFLSTLDSGIINIAIPTFLQVFDSKLETVVWTITLYTLILSATIMLFGQLADRYGRLKIYRTGLILFGVTSLFCGLATNIHLLIFFRALQGLSAAMMQATALAVIITRVPKETAPRALALLGTLMGLGPTLGPVVGGVILSTIGWQWIFWINIPICLYGIYGCKRLNATAEVLHTNPLGYMNLLWFGVAMLFVLLGMNYLSQDLALSLLFFVMMFITFGFHFYLEKRSLHPVINYHLYKEINFAAPMIGVFASGLITAIAFILPPLYFEKLRGFLPWQVGLISAATSLGVVVGSQFFPYLSKQLGIKNLILTGMIIVNLALLVLVQMQLNWAPMFIFILLFIYGLGINFFMMPTLSYLTSQFPHEKQAFISALIRMTQNAAIAFGAAGSALLISLKANISIAAEMRGIAHAWWFAEAFGGIALVALIAMFLKDKMKN